MSNLNIQINKKSFLLKTEKSKNENLIFKNLKINITNGQFVSIFGPSGCGKTTLLNMVAGLDKSFNGFVDINTKTNAKSNIGYMFQSPRLFSWLNSIENIRFPIKNKPNSLKIANELIKKIGLEKYKNEYPNRLSGGMQRRLALARAFSTEPNILLLDEPFISIDKNTSNSLRELLIKLWKKNKPTIIFVTHDLDEALELSDRIIFLSNLPSKVLLDYKINLKRPRNRDSRKFISVKRLISSTTRVKK
tara:strand:+ start:939 stop:1682 length:744 start_codon:yes stop_codon:yes gene_type:complete